MNYSRIFIALLLAVLLATAVFFATGNRQRCLIGAFLSDSPSAKNITDFENAYGKKPYLVMVFIDWGKFIDKKIIGDIYGQGCVLFVTWEPWEAADKAAVDYDGLLAGKYDKYIADFSSELKNTAKPVFLRFAHEMNGDWYPWSGVKIGKDKYIMAYRHVKDVFTRNGADNVKWVFSVNWEDVPGDDNHFVSYYPGDTYVDYIGIDGYNWGNTRQWGRWMSFRDIFGGRYWEIAGTFNKPVLISEFSSASRGGDKAAWIKEAMDNIKKMKKIKGFVLFNLDKEADWAFPADKEAGKELGGQLKSSYFIGGKNDQQK